jgi:acetyl esterase/lipase
MNEPAFELNSALTYATHDGVALQGDLYLPKARGSVPAPVAIHGGGWQQGARDAFRHWGPYLAARGHALFAVSYRFAKKGKKAFPEAVRDVLAAVQHVRGNAAALGIDGGRVGLFGGLGRRPSRGARRARRPCPGARRRLSR